MSALTPRFVPPRGHLHSYGQLQTLMSRPQISYRRLPVCRYASATASKPRVLEKPTRFNPPSHGKRLKQQIPRQYGPQLTAQQKTEQRTKKYPHMMPAEGTFMYWFLTNQGLHTFITLGTLVLLACITAFERWRVATAFREQLPAGGDFFSQPLTAISQAFEVWVMDMRKDSDANNAERKEAVEDMLKRRKYRVAHGLEDPDSPGFFEWTPRDDAEYRGSGAKPNPALVRPVGVEPGQEVEVESIVKSGTEREGRLEDLEGRERRPVKKWLGIW